MAMKQRVLSEIAWDAPGEVVEGILLSVTLVKYQDGGTNCAYLVKRPDGVIMAFQGSSRLNKLLHRSDVGCPIQVTYRGKDAAPVAANMSPKKLFDVLVDEDGRMSAMSAPKPGAAPGSDPGITDDDIPF